MQLAGRQLCRRADEECCLVATLGMSQNKPANDVLAPSTFLAKSALCVAICQPAAKPEANPKIAPPTKTLTRDGPLAAASTDDWVHSSLDQEAWNTLALRAVVTPRREVQRRACIEGEEKRKDCRKLDNPI